MGLTQSLTVGGSATYAPGGMEGSPKATRSGQLYNFGIGGSAVDSGASGKVCLIQRGTVDFSTKVSNCQTSGGVGRCHLQQRGRRLWRHARNHATTIPSVTASDTEGAAMLGQVGQTATVAVTASPTTPSSTARRWPRRTSRRWLRWCGAAT
jgi:hypothetical protein